MLVAGRTLIQTGPPDRRAHEERVIVMRQVFAAPAKIVRQLFAALTWRAPAEPNLRIAHEH
jgi:hypothetical protein